jgi:hypothetical protein
MHFFSVTFFQIIRIKFQKWDFMELYGKFINKMGFIKFFILHLHPEIL